MKVFGIAGYSGSGKTTLLEKLLPRLLALGLRVSVIKHTHHAFDIDQPGKDSYRHRAAGASEVLIASGTRWVLMNELREAPEPTLEEYLAHFSPCDLVLLEGFKQEAIPKLEVYRPTNGTPPLWPDNPYVVAVACDFSAHHSAAYDATALFPVDFSLPVFDLNDADAIVCFILNTLEIEGKPHAIV